MRFNRGGVGNTGIKLEGANDVFILKQHPNGHLKTFNGEARMNAVGFSEHCAILLISITGAFPCWEVLHFLCFAYIYFSLAFNDLVD